MGSVTKTKGSDATGDEIADSGHKLSAHWHLPYTKPGHTPSIRTLDLVIHPEKPSADPDTCIPWSSTTLETSGLPSWLSSRVPTVQAADAPLIALKVILPQTRGYWVRTNIISQRFIDSDVKSVLDFAKARQLCEPVDIEASELSDLLATAVGAIECHATEFSARQLETELVSFEAEVHNRLSLPLVLPDPIARYRLAIIHGWFNFKTVEMLYQAAQDLDIEVYILAAPGHWFGDDIYAEFRKEYVPMDIQRVDDSLGERIVEALRERDIEVDGITALTDKWLIPAAQAALILGLPTEPLRMYEVCRDKFLTRQLDSPVGFMSECVEGLKGAEIWLERLECNEQVLEYPLVVKPCAGWASEGVRKVYNRAALLDAVKKANLNDYSRGDSITIETYIDGPEFDANFILSEGEPLFVEISDQFPAEADLDTSSQTNFLETELFLPSALPSNEQATIRAGMLEVLRKLGCKNGVHHMEGRMRNSAMEYGVTAGPIDLVPTSKAAHTDPESVLIENNPRPPGTNSNAVILHTYGVEFYAAHLLLACGDTARVRALSVPFAKGQQYHCDLVSIPVVRGGVLATRDATAELLERSPNLRPLVRKCGCYFGYGEKVPDPSSGVWTQIAYFMLASRTSRREVIDAAAQIRKDFRYKLVESVEELDM